MRSRSVGRHGAGNKNSGYATLRPRAPTPAAASPNSPSSPDHDHRRRLNTVKNPLAWTNSSSSNSSSSSSSTTFLRNFDHNRLGRIDTYCRPNSAVNVPGNDSQLQRRSQYIHNSASISHADQPRSRSVLCDRLSRRSTVNPAIHASPLSSTLSSSLTSSSSTHQLHTVNKDRQGRYVINPVERTDHVDAADLLRRTRGDASDRDTVPSVPPPSSRPEVQRSRRLYTYSAAPAASATPATAVGAAPDHDESPSSACAVIGSCAIHNSRIAGTVYAALYSCSSASPYIDVDEDASCNSDSRYINGAHHADQYCCTPYSSSSASDSPSSTIVDHDLNRLTRLSLRSSRKAAAQSSPSNESASSRAVQRRITRSCSRSSFNGNDQTQTCSKIGRPAVNESHTQTEEHHHVRGYNYTGPAAAAVTLAARGPSAASSSSSRNISCRPTSRNSVTTTTYSCLMKGLSCVVGLHNEGNTCYLNSWLQCLAHTLPFAAAMLGYSSSLGEELDLIQRKLISSTKRPSITSCAAVSRTKRDEYSSSCCNNSISSSVSAADSLAVELRELLRRMWSEPPFSSTSASSFLHRLLAWNPQFSGYQQQDAQEAMRAILDGLHESLNRANKEAIKKYVDIYAEYGSRPKDELAQITWDYHKSMNDSIIQDIFCGQLQSTIECSLCQQKSHCFDPFLDLSLPLPDNNIMLAGRSYEGSSTSPCNVTIEDCLALFVAPEMLKGSDKYNCATCKAPQTSIKKLNIYRAPPILVLHLKRFNGSSGSSSYKKNDTPIYYPLRGLDLTKFLGTNPQQPQALLYDLYAVCYHSGSLGYGHYTAQCKNADGLWYSFNDALVNAMEESSIIKSSAYILFYQQQGL